MAQSACRCVQYVDNRSWAGLGHFALIETPTATQTRNMLRKPHLTWSEVTLLINIAKISQVLILGITASAVRFEVLHHSISYGQHIRLHHPSLYPTGFLDASASVEAVKRDVADIGGGGLEMMPFYNYGCATCNNEKCHFQRDG